MSYTRQATEISIDSEGLEGELVVPKDPNGLVLFAHGSGSSHHSPRNNAVAKHLRDADLGTFIFDLLTEEEDLVRSSRFDISLLTNRLATATEWIGSRPETEGLPSGYFGASTGAAAALRAGGREVTSVYVIVSRDGRVDMAVETATEINVPCLIIVGSEDTDVLELNEKVFDELSCEKRLTIAEGAGHLFEANGQLGEVSHLASGWFLEHLAGSRQPHSIL